MSKQKTELQKKIGKLISFIQKEWGEDGTEFSENVMYSAHDLLQAGTVNNIKVLLGNLTVYQYLGEVWVQRHPKVKNLVADIEDILSNEN